MPESLVDRQTALTCYLNAIVAIAKSMEQVCPQVGMVYRDRLLRLPRRLGFNANAAALEETRRTVEGDLAAYTRRASMWVSQQARQIQEIASAIEYAGQAEDLHYAMLEDLADQMESSAEVDSEPTLRTVLRRNASGLRGYIRMARRDRRAALGDLQRRSAELNHYAADPVTGLLDREEAEEQLRTHLDSGEPFCLVLFEWSRFRETDEEQMVAKFAEQLVSLVRPSDLVCRWGTHEFAVIFECTGAEALTRSGKIAEWLSTEVLVARVAIEPLPGETMADVVRRADEAFAPATHALTFGGR